MSSSSRVATSRTMVSAMARFRAGGRIASRYPSSSARCISPTSCRLRPSMVTSRRARLSRAPPHSGQSYSTITFFRYSSIPAFEVPCFR